MYSGVMWYQAVPVDTIGPVKAHNLRLGDDLFTRIDAARGDVPRNKWIVKAIEAALATSTSDLDRLKSLTASPTPVSRADAFRNRKER
jgi:hypothetical protein